MEEQDRKPATSWSPFDILVEAVGAIGVVALVVATLTTYGRLQERIPIHFGFSGQPDRWGHRAALLVLSVLALLIYGGLSALARIPHHFNYPWPITATNSQRQYLLARRLLRIVKVTILWLFLGILVGTTLVAAGTWSRLPPWFLLSGLGAMAMTISWYFVAASRAR